jgi:predicted  nucleic acid-binding Zn-ribbon protein
MATAVLENRSLESLKKSYQEANVELTGLRQKLSVEQVALDKLRDRYNQACRHVATGSRGEDPATVQKEMQVVENRVVGLGSIIIDKESALKSLHADYLAADALEQERVIAAEDARLLAAEKEAARAFEEQEKAVAAAWLALNGARQALQNFRWRNDEERRRRARETR